ncbi:6-carboxyhexanoate--CoA ligase [Staphylococcus schleiferi]|uniref:6-carboxyhexanoate--CoA ligase n=1 Tax=Staphylococcus schleiferi TaxID=1295 RepID=UPI00247FB8F7|nr:6-carboxyhexanoate--CoA ligase [Staphylococcus schleiferi]
MYSVKMRANQNEQHTSGAETICEKEQIVDVIQTFFEKGFHHENGEADFLNLKIEKVTQPLMRLPALSIIDRPNDKIAQLCNENGITQEALNKGMAYIFNSIQYSGALILSAQTGERLDRSGDRGIRVTQFCFDDQGPQTYKARVKDALAIASCTTASPYVKGELCVSDDLNYTTGYFATRRTGYHRIHQIKAVGTRQGGRIIFVDDRIHLEHYVTFLEQQPKQITTLDGSKEK